MFHVLLFQFNWFILYRKSTKFADIFKKKKREIYNKI